MSRSYINKFIFGYDISPSFLLIGTAILLVGISFLQLQPIIAQVQPPEANLTSADKQMVVTCLRKEIRDTLIVSAGINSSHY
ncbi:MAG: hypothetical protein WB706_13040 [Nitrososphaeraceae archaeon]